MHVDPPATPPTPATPDPLTPREIDLVVVDDAVLDRLVQVAITDAAPDDVTPSLGPGWTDERIEWLRAFHRLRRAGLSGGEEETAAIRVDGRIVGGTRLHRSSPESPDRLEWGIWVARSSRRRGVASVVLRLAMDRAIGAGATSITARTTAGNTAMLALLGRAGATFANHPDGAVHAEVPLEDDAAVDARDQEHPGPAD